jgi:hypothetical protein
MKLQEQQSVFSAYLRNPALNAAPEGIEARRMKIYSELFFNNMLGLVCSAFPVLKSLHTEEEWSSLVREFYASHKAQTPYFLEISKEFLAWLDDETLPVHQRFPFASALAHYEWVELGLDVAEEEAVPGIDPDGDLQHGVPVLSPLAWPLVYQWPVHHISPECIPKVPSTDPVCLVAYRNSCDQVEFLEANVATIRLIELIAADNGLSGEQLLLQLAGELPSTPVESVVGYGVRILKQLHHLGVIPGVKKC